MSLKIHSRILTAIVIATGAGAATAAPVTGQISVSGYAQAVGSVGMGAATGLDFANASGTSVSGASGALASWDAATGSFAALGNCTSPISCGTIMDIASFAASAPISTFFALTTGGPPVAFDLGSITSVTKDLATDSVSFTGTGTIHFAGFDDTAGSFSLTAQGDNIVAFTGALIAGSAPVTTVPEPTSLALVGAALAGLGMLRRKSV